jgi:hypothetical protein
MRLAGVEGGLNRAVGTAAKTGSEELRMHTNGAGDPDVSQYPGAVPREPTEEYMPELAAPELAAPAPAPGVEVAAPLPAPDDSLSVAGAPDDDWASGYADA